MSKALEAAARAVASTLSNDEGTPFQPRVTDLDRAIAIAAITAYLRAVAEGYRQRIVDAMTETITGTGPDHDYDDDMDRALCAALRELEPKE